MRSERGQASVEWIGLVLLLALAWRRWPAHAPRDAAPWEPSSCTRWPARRAAAARRSATGARGTAPRGAAAPSARHRAAARARARQAGAAAPGGAARVGDRLRPPRLLSRFCGGRAGCSAGRARRRRAWRRAWLACLVYERIRWSVSTRRAASRTRDAASEDLRITNDCISPVDLVRDWELLRAGHETAARARPGQRRVRRPLAARCPSRSPPLRRSRPGRRALVRRLPRAPLRLRRQRGCDAASGRSCGPTASATPQGARARAEPRLRARRAPASGRLARVPPARVRERAGRARARRPPVTPASAPPPSPA